LQYLAFNRTGRDARLLAVKVSPLLSALAVVLALQFLPNYSYPDLALVVLVVATVGALVAYTVPSPFIRLLRLVASDPGKVVLWRKEKKPRKD